VIGLYFGTHALDVSAYHGELTLPSWTRFGTADSSLADPDHAGRRGDHGRRRGLLDHDRDADAGLDAVRAANAAELHSRPRNAADARHIRGDVRLRDARADLNRRRRRVERQLRPPPVDHRRGRARRGVDGRTDLLHQSHRDDDPAAAGDREHRARPVGGNRRGDHVGGEGARGGPIRRRARAADGRERGARSPRRRAATSSSSSTSRWFDWRPRREP